MAYPLPNPFPRNGYFYSPNLHEDKTGGGYGSSFDWDKTPLVEDYLDPQIPQGVYTSYLANNGFGGQDRRSTWARGMYGQTQSGYQAALRENPTLSYADYLTKQFGTTGLANMWAGLSSEQQGVRPGQQVGKTGVIAWG